MNERKGLSIVVKAGDNKDAIKSFLENFLSVNNYAPVEFVLLFERQTKNIESLVSEFINYVPLTCLYVQNKTFENIEKKLRYSRVLFVISIESFEKKTYQQLLCLLNTHSNYSFNSLNQPNTMVLFGKTLLKEFSSHSLSIIDTDTLKGLLRAEHLKNIEFNQVYENDKVVFSGEKLVDEQIENLLHCRGALYPFREDTWKDYIRLRDSQNKNRKPKIKEKIYAGLASIPSRSKTLPIVLDRIKKQVDHVFVYLNNYEEIPDCVKCENVTFELSSNYKDLAAAGKFYFVENAKGNYYFSMDDDVLYPDDYIWKMIETLKKYNNEAVVCGHGSVFGTPLEWYFERVEVFNFAKELKNDKFVNLLGTGATGFYYDSLSPKISHFLPEAMCDLQLSIMANLNNIPIVNIKRPRNWFGFIEDDPLQASGNDYFNKMLIDDGLRSDLATRVNWSYDRYKKLIANFLARNFPLFNYAQFKREHLDTCFINSIYSQAVPKHWNSDESKLFHKRKYENLIKRIKIIQNCRAYGKMDHKKLFPNKDSVILNVNFELGEYKTKIIELREKLNHLESLPDKHKKEMN